MFFPRLSNVSNRFSKGDKKMFMLFVSAGLLNPIENFKNWISGIIQSLIDLGQVFLEGAVVLAVIALGITAIISVYKSIRSGSTITQAAKSGVIWLTLACILAAVSVIAPVALGLRPTFAEGLRNWANTIF